MGGVVVLCYAYHYPDEVNQPVLFASAGLALNQGTSLPLLAYDGIVKNYYLQYLGFRSVYWLDAYKATECFNPMHCFTSLIFASTEACVF